MRVIILDPMFFQTTLAAFYDNPLKFMNRPIAIKPLPDSKFGVIFNDGLEGLYDISSLIGEAVFSLLKDPSKFNQVHIAQYGQITWSEEMEICSDAVHKKSTREALAHN